MQLSNFSDLARVVIIDDNLDEGNGIKSALEGIQIPALFHHVTSNRSLDNKVAKNVRLVFLDLMFSDSRSPNAAQNASNTLSKLSKIIAGPAFYILVIWSNHTTEEVAITFKDHLERQDQFAKPYKVLELQKSTYLTAGGKWRAREIIRDINSQLSEIPSLKVFLGWEGIINDSVTELSNKIIGQKDQENLSRTVNSLAMAYAGRGGALRDKPKNALMAFNEVFKGATSQNITKTSFGNLYRSIDNGDLSDPEKSKLNSSLIFTPDINPGPGSIFKIRLSARQKENFVKDILNHDIASLGTSYDEIIPIAIEITPLCNAAQQSSSHAYFLNGLIYPVEYTNVAGNQSKIKIKPDYCFALGKGYWDDEKQREFTLSFNLKLFHSTISDRYISLEKKVRDNIVIDLQHKVSGYISRPGHVLL